MADDNKPLKYMRYAIGEIVLVVIGILIALQINTWNEKIKNEKLGIIFLKDFKSDLKTDIETLDYHISLNNTRISNTDSIFVSLSNKNELSANELTDFFNQNLVLLGESYFIPEKSTIRQFEASSNSHLISSKTLKDKIFRYYSTNDRNENNTEKSIQLYQHNFITKEIIQPILGGDILEMILGSSLNRSNLDLRNLKQNSEYLFSLIAKKTSTISQNLVYQNTKIMAEELIEQINIELEK